MLCIAHVCIFSILPVSFAAVDWARHAARSFPRRVLRDEPKRRLEIEQFGFDQGPCVVFLGKTLMVAVPLVTMQY